MSEERYRVVMDLVDSPIEGSDEINVEFIRRLFRSKDFEGFKELCSSMQIRVENIDIGKV